MLETTSQDGTPLDTHGVEDLLHGDAGHSSYRELADRLLASLHEHAAADSLAHDDVTFFLGEFVEGPRGHALWHVLRNRLLRRAPTMADLGT